MNTIAENGLLTGTWNDELATDFFSNPDHAGIKKLVIKDGHNFQTFSWLSLLTSLEELEISGTHDTILDLSHLPSVDGRDLLVQISGHFQNITNWSNTSATSLSLLHIKLSNLQPDDWGPTEKWGQNLKSFTAYDSLPLDFSNLNPKQLKSFHVESSALGLKSLAGCTLDYFGGDENSLNSLYEAFKDNTDQCPTAKETQIVNGSILGLGGLLKWLAPQKISSFTDQLSSLNTLSQDQHQINGILSTFPQKPCTFEMNNIISSTSLEPQTFLSAMQERGHTVVFPDSSALSLDKSTHKVSSGKPLSPLTMTTFADCEMNESDIQKILIHNFPTKSYNEPLESFAWAEDRKLLNNNCIFLASEFSPLPSDISGGRIDILAMDENGYSVVFELKDKNDSGQLGQALGYVSMLSELDGKDFFSLLSLEKQQELTAFMEKNNLSEAQLNRGQRIVLVAESFEAQTQLSVEWMNTIHGQTNPEETSLLKHANIPFIECICMIPFTDTQNNIFLHLAPIEPFDLGQKLSAKKDDIAQVISYTTNEAARALLDKYSNGEWNTKFLVRYVRWGNYDEQRRVWKIFGPGK